MPKLLRFFSLCGTTIYHYLLAAQMNHPETNMSSTPVPLEVEDNLKRAARSASEDEDLEEKSAAAPSEAPKKKRKTTDSVKPRRKKPRDAPRRPLSAYNIYFRDARAALIARNDEGNPDEDFQINLDAVVATGKKRDDPSAIFQAAARTLAARWKKMDPKDKAEYEQSAEEEMKRYRARVYEYESRMVEEARSRSNKADSGLDASASSHGAAQDSLHRLEPQLAAGNLSSQLLGSTAGLQLLGGGLPWQGQGLGYTLLHPGLHALGGLPTRTFAPQGSSEALLQALQAQNAGYGGNNGAASGATGYERLLAQRVYEQQILAALQRENLLQERFQTARLTGAPVAMTIIPPGVTSSGSNTTDPNLLAQLLERERQARGGAGAGAGGKPSAQPPSQSPP